MKPIRVGLLGFGTVGGGTYEILRRNQEEIQRRAGRGIEIVKIAVRDAARARTVVGAGIEVTDSPEQLVGSAGIDIVVELIGGCDPARALVLEAIATTSTWSRPTRRCWRLHGNEIFAAAHRVGVVMVAFEGAVAGGIPIIKALREGLTANRIEWIAGIINGTSNFILSQMRATGASFESVLEQAQALGYAGGRPSLRHRRGRRRATS